MTRAARQAARQAARPIRPAEVRYYFDADVLGLGKILADTRTDTAPALADRLPGCGR